MFFRRKRDKIIDLTPLERIRKKKEQSEYQKNVIQEDLTAQTTTQQNSDIFSSFSALATNENFDSQNENYFSKQEDNVKENIKLKEIEERIDKLSRRIYSLVDRVDLLEKKVRRLEGS
ncbi:MAG: hypothetical protein QW117_03305 [Candidatus Pacearchaeota archaeon]